MTPPREKRNKKKKTFEHILGKVENTGNKHFPVFKQYFLSCERQIN